MKKGLNVTLLTVAIAVLAIQAMGHAPVIQDIKSPVVGNENGATNATPFVYPDAFDITAKATDDSTSPANIRWSYYYTGSEVYRINNVDRVALNDAAINAPGAAQINGTTKDPGDVDANAATITIRNVKYAPITGTGATPAAGVIDAMPVTLFASDGTTYSSAQVYFYTDNGGNDRLSPTDSGTVIYKQTAWPNSNQGNVTWAYSILQLPTQTVSSGTSGGTAVCITSAPQGLNWAQWTSSWGIFSVDKNMVYRIRARINGTQTTAESSPFFDLVIGNNDDASSQGFTLFGGDYMVFDNEGGANAPMQKNATSGTTYEWFWAPSCMLNAAFNNDTTVWSSGNANNRKMYMMFRVMDLNSVAALTADNDSGTLCLNDLEIQAIPYSALSFQQVWASTTFTGNGQAASGNNVQYVDYVGTTAIEGGKIKISPTTASQTSTYGNAAPGDGLLGTATSNFVEMDDDYPVAWEANTLYKITWNWSAVDAASETHPLDVIWTGMDCPSYEFIQNSYVTSKVTGYPAMPKFNSGTPQEYVSFFYSMNVSATAYAHRKRFRPRAEWANSDKLIDSTSAGMFYIHGARVDKVTGY